VKPLRDIFTHAIFVAKQGGGVVEKSVGMISAEKQFTALRDAQLAGLAGKYHKSKTKRAATQGARKQARVCAAHAKIKNSHIDHLH
jgi:hypothetical protein